MVTSTSSVVLLEASQHAFCQEVRALDVALGTTTRALLASATKQDFPKEAHPDKPAIMDFPKNLNIRCHLSCELCALGSLSIQADLKVIWLALTSCTMLSMWDASCAHER